MKKLLILFSFIFIFFFTLSTPVFAGADFITNYGVLYEVTPEGRLWVTENISLTNKLSQVYAAQYSLNLERSKPQNISASDEIGPLKITTETKGESTAIILYFNQQVVGKDKTLKFNLKYELPDLIRRSGQVWEITVPKLSETGDIDAYNLTLKVPVGFDQPAFISPNPRSQKTEGNSQLFFFSKDQVVDAGVIAAFGKFQVFDFSLTYHLVNPTADRVKTSIALPPDTNYQKLSYKSINPEPENVEVDNDGNWMGVYKLQPKERLEITSKGQVKIFAQPQIDQVQFFDEEQLEKYLQPQEYWETTDPKIASLAQKLRTPKQIHDYVVKTLDYDYSRVREGATRFGALKALENPERAICMEYTDLFVAIARAAGIPARELNGYAHTANPLLQPLSLVQDVLHAWPEYWDDKKKSWIQIDPTWQDTTGGVDYFSKLDLGHFVFAIHGEDSQSPPPAGSYKENNQTQKDVQISFGQYQEPPKLLVDVDFLLPEKIITEVPTEGKIRVFNPGPEAFANLELKITTENFKLVSEARYLFALLPPFASREIPFKLANTGFFTQRSGKITVSVNNQQFEHALTSESIILKKIIPILGSLILLGLLYFIARKLFGPILNKWVFKRKVV